MSTVQEQHSDEELSEPAVKRILLTESKSALDLTKDDLGNMIMNKCGEIFLKPKPKDDLFVVVEYEANRVEENSAPTKFFAVPSARFFWLISKEDTSIVIGTRTPGKYCTSTMMSTTNKNPSEEFGNSSVKPKAIQPGADVSAPTPSPAKAGINNNLGMVGIGAGTLLTLYVIQKAMRR
uniref:Uncharacterized protein n=1 Tax=Ditylenchus dipsaci TaxID=166011 RepID=A0A915D474_9BILA